MPPLPVSTQHPRAQTCPSHPPMLTCPRGPEQSRLFFTPKERREALKLQD